MPAVDPVPEYANVHYLTHQLSSTMGYLIDRSMFCLTTFLAAVSSFHSVKSESAQSNTSSEYLIGLGMYGPILRISCLN